MLESSVIIQSSINNENKLVEMTKSSLSPSSKKRDLLKLQTMNKNVKENTENTLLLSAIGEGFVSPTSPIEFQDLVWASLISDSTSNDSSIIEEEDSDPLPNTTLSALESWIEEI